MANIWAQMNRQEREIRASVTEMARDSRVKHDTGKYLIYVSNRCRVLSVFLGRLETFYLRNLDQHPETRDRLLKRVRLHQLKVKKLLEQARFNHRVAKDLQRSKENAN